MKNLLRFIALLTSMLLISPNSYAAVKAGSTCTKAGLKIVSGRSSYTCINSGKKLVWDKGVLVAKSTAGSGAGTATEMQAKEGDPCQKMGLQARDLNGLLECRRFSENRLAFVRIRKDYSPVVNSISPDPMALCQLSDKRTVVPIEQQNGIPLAIAYPPTPFPNFPGATGTFKVAVVGVDFPDVPGKGSPSELWKEDLVKASEWMNWYTNGKVKLDFVTSTKWFRAPKVSGSYDADNNGDRAPGDKQTGGLTAQEMSDDYIHAIENGTDLNEVNSIWVYLPPNVKKPDGQFNPHSAGVQTKKFGIVRSQLVVNGADTYLSARPRWAFYLHEMIHAMGVQGHSPKFIPADGTDLNLIGQMSTAAGWTNALLPWDALTWGVSKPSDVYCIDKPHLSTIELKLVPLEREQIGFRSAMIRLNDHQVVLVESHQKDKWGVGEGAGFDVVMVAVIDTTVSTTFDGPNTAKDPCTVSTGIYLKVPNVSHGQHKPVGTKIINSGVIYQGSGVINGTAVAGDYMAWDLNRFMYIGESISTSGVRVTFVSSGDNATVKIENVDKTINEYVQTETPLECKSKLVPKKDSKSSNSQTNPNPFPYSTEISSPSDLGISANANSIELSWKHATKGKVEIEYYRIKGSCIKDGAPCGNYTTDIWILPSGDGSPMKLTLTPSMLGNPPSGGSWQFYLGAANQTKAVSAKELGFEKVTAFF